VSTTRIALCGPLVVEIDGRRLEGDLPGRQGRLLLAYLAAHRRRPVSRAELIEVLWPSDAPAAPEAALKVLLARLRRVVGAALAGRADVSLELPDDAVVDVEVVERSVADAEAALERADPHAAMEIAIAALAIADRPLVPEFDGGWVHERRRELQEQASALLEAEATAALRIGGDELAQGERAARELTRREPFRESGYAVLMEIHDARGNVAEAVRVFDELRVLLRDELGTAPSAPIVALNERLLRGAPEIAAPPRPVSVPLPRLPGDDGDAAPRVRFVGREAELERLRERWREACDGEPHLVLVGGEAGVGKTRLLTHFAREVHGAGANVLYGRCDEGALLPYQPFMEALRHFVVHCGPPQLPGQAEPELAELARLVPELRSGAGAAAAPAPGEPETQRYRLFEAMTGFFAGVAGAAPLLLVLDDVQWADKPTLLLLRHLFRRSADAPLLVLSAYRDVEVATAPLEELLAEVRRDRRVDRIALTGVSERDTTAIVSAGSSLRPRADFVAQLHERTGGNPLYIQELLRDLAESGGELAELAVPAGVQEVIGRRLARLSGPTLSALEAAAVIGSELDLATLAAATGEPSDALLDALEEGVRGGLLAEDPEVVDRFAFAHALVRQTLYERQMRSRRVRLHQRIAEALATSGAANPAELARHAFEARALIGPAVVVGYLRAAAAQASRSLAYEEAGDHYRRALQVIDERDGDALVSERCALLLSLGRSQWRAGDEEARASFRSAAQLARELRAPEPLAWAALGLAGRYWEAHAMDATLTELLEEALEELGTSESVLRTRVMGRLAEVLHFSGQPERALELSEEALASARRLEDPTAVAVALTGRHVALLHIEHLEERLRVSAEVLELAARMGQLELGVQGLHWRIYDLFELGDGEAVIAEHGKLSALAAELRQPLLRSLAACWQAAREQMAGHWEEAERLSDEALALGRRAHATDADSLHGAQALVRSRDAGRLPEMLERMQDVAARYRAIPAWPAAMACAHVAAGDHQRARELCAELMADGLARVPRNVYWLSTVAFLCEACAALPDHPGLDVLEAELAPHATRMVQISSAACLGSAAHFLGVLAAAAGRHDDADRHFTAAADRNRALGALTALARTECEHGATLLARGADGDAARAAVLLGSAEAAARRLGMGPLAERASALATLASAPSLG
jgi:DNA-binding SARP family transcriptional activator/tetratricopeptide (TPR) repeat protein